MLLRSAAITTIATIARAASCAPGAPPDASCPTAPQLWYAEGEIMALIHFNMATFVKDGDPGCSALNWNHKMPHAAGLSSGAGMLVLLGCSCCSAACADAEAVSLSRSPDPATFNPKKLNTSQWGDIMLSLGVKGAILTAKHGCGHLRACCCSCCCCCCWWCWSRRWWWWW